MYELELKLKKASSLKYESPNSPKLIKSVSGEYAEIMVESAREIEYPRRKESRLGGGAELSS